MVVTTDVSGSTIAAYYSVLSVTIKTSSKRVYPHNPAVEHVLSMCHPLIQSLP